MKTNRQSKGADTTSVTTFARIHPQFLPIVVALVTSVLSNVLGLGAQVWSVSTSPSSHSSVHDDHSRSLPINLNTVNMIFHDDPEHYSLKDMKASAEWESIIPEGAGVVHLGHASRPYMVSMWHQIYCLNHIRNALVEGDHDTAYTEHCFHYLRQGILCAADTTVEPLSNKELGGGHTWQPPPGNVTHTCRDWQQVYNWMNEQGS